MRNYASACSGNGGVAGRTQRQQGHEDKLSNMSNGTGHNDGESVHTEAGKVQEEVGAGRTIDNLKETYPIHTLKHHLMPEMRKY